MTNASLYSYFRSRCAPRARVRVSWHAAGAGGRSRRPRTKVGQCYGDVGAKVRTEADPVYPAARFRDCNRSLAEQYDRLQPPDTSPEAERFRQRAWLLLAAVVSTLKSLGVPHLISAGTLLGYVRQCDLVPEMADVDVQIPSEAVTGERGQPSVHQVVEAICSAGPRRLSVTGTANHTTMVAFTDQSDLKLELYVSYPAADGSRHIGAVDPSSLDRIRWSFPAPERCWGLLRGLQVGVPCDPGAYLRALYGERWMLPLNGTWDYRTGGLVKRVGRWPEEMRHEVFKQY